MNINWTILICILSFFSSQSQSVYEKEVIECLESQLDKNYDQTKYIYETFKELESYLVDKKILNGINKSDYLDFIQKAINKDYTKIVPKDKHIYQFSPSLIIGCHKDCVIQIMRKHKGPERLESMIEAYDAFEASGVSDFNYLKKIVENMDFNYEKSRLIATLLVYYSILDE